MGQQWKYPLKSTQTCHQAGPNRRSNHVCGIHRSPFCRAQRLEYLIILKCIMVSLFTHHLGQLCLVRFTPPGPGGCHHRLECVLNNDPGSTEQTDLFGQGAWPAVEVTSCGGGEAGDDEQARSLAAGSVGASSGSSIRVRERLDRDEGSVVYMRPTCVGIVSSGMVKVSPKQPIVKLGL